MFHITSLDALAREAYDAFVTTVNGTIALPMPVFDDLPTPVQDAWKEASRRVAELTH